MSHAVNDFDTVKLSVTISVFGSLVLSVVWNFFRRRGPVESETTHRIPVNALTISIGMALCGAAVVSGFGTVENNGLIVRCFQSTAGLLLLVAGGVLNLWGRRALGRLWSDENTVFHDHALVTTGPYRLIRHPLFSALICLYLGLGFTYENLFVTLFGACVAIPLLFWRARKEEMSLSAKFPAYGNYRLTTGMFLPKVRKVHSNDGNNAGKRQAANGQNIR